MADVNEKLLMTLLKKTGNNMCADCNSKCECDSNIIFPIIQNIFQSNFYHRRNDENVTCLLE